MNTSKKIFVNKLKEFIEINEENLEDMNAENIYRAGVNWEQFNYDKGLDALIKKDKTGEWIYYAGREWKQFDYNKGLDELIKKDKDGQWIYRAGMEWKQFDYEKGLDELIKKDKKGQYIYLAGLDWEQFDFNKGWKQFDYEKGLDELIKKDKKGQYIYKAGAHWKHFNYNKGFDELIKKDKEGNWIYDAGMIWRQFNYKKGLDVLKKLKDKYYHNKALKHWPKGIKQTKEITKEIRRTAIKDPNRKKFKLKEFVEINEGLKRFKYSKKLKKAIDKLEKQSFKLPDEKESILDRVIVMLKEDILKRVEKIERDFVLKKMNRKEARKQIKNIKIKMKEIKRFIKDKIGVNLPGSTGIMLTFQAINAILFSIISVGTFMSLTSEDIDDYDGFFEEISENENTKL